LAASSNRRTFSRVLPLLIVLFAFGVRCYDLDRNPPGFFRDEADKAVTAKSLLLTGRDLEGRRLPYFVRSLNVYTSGAYQYALVPFLLLLGMGEWVIRLPAALAGAATVTVAYLLGKEAYGRSTGLVVSALLAISPWHVCLSRWANQGTFLPLCLSLAVYYLLRGRRSTQVSGESAIPPAGRNCRPFVISAIFLSLALYTYAPAKVLVPLFVVAMAAIYRRELFTRPAERRWPCCTKYFGILLLLALPMAHFTLFEAERSGLRYDRISIFSQAASPAELVLLFFQGYLSHFSPSFLLSTGDANLRHSVPGVGQLLWPEAIAALLGLYFLLRRRSREDLLLLAWVALGPLPAALTREGLPHALRSIGALPSVQLLGAVGIVQSLEFLRRRETSGAPRSFSPRRIVLVAWVAAFILFGGSFLATLFWVYPVVSAPWWEYGYGEAVAYLERHRGDYEEIVITGLIEYPQVQILYHTGGDPAEYQRTGRISGYRFLPLGRPYVEDYQRSTRKSLYLLTPFEHERVPRPALHRIKHPDGSPAWLVVEHPAVPK